MTRQVLFAMLLSCGYIDCHQAPSHTQTVTTPGAVAATPNGPFPELEPETGLCAKVPRRAMQLSAGLATSCALFADGSVLCWGKNVDGQLGQGDTEDRGDEPNELAATEPINLKAQVVRIVSRGTRTCVVTSDGRVGCWGRNDYGALGIGISSSTVLSRGSRADDMGGSFVWTNLSMPVRDVVLGTSHACALSDRGKVKCWGWNESGQLGLGDSRSRGSSNEEMGDSLPQVDLGANRSAVSLAAGDSHTCAVLDDGQIKCWGDNQFGQLGQGDTRNRGTRPDEMGESLAPVDLGKQLAKAVAAGAQHTCALLNDGDVKCWGANIGGVLGTSTSTQVGDSAADMGTNLHPLRFDKNVKAAAIFASDYRNCVIKTNDQLACWGHGSDGELGPIPTDTKAASKMKGQAHNIDISSSAKPVGLAMGFSHSCVLLDDGNVKCWGDGAHGALGNGSTETIGRSESQMGDNLRVVNFGTACARR